MELFITAYLITATALFIRAIYIAYQTKTGTVGIQGIFEEEGASHLPEPVLHIIVLLSAILHALTWPFWFICDILKWFFSIFNK
jgi:hypothetical protein